jgi:hypothetical protein
MTDLVDSILRIQSVLFNSLVMVMREKGVLTIDECEKIFNVAEKKASTHPDVQRAVRAIHDEIPWDEMYRQAAQRRP